VRDPSQYSLRGSLSDWTDVFSGYGSFNVTAGSAAGQANSYFHVDDNFAHHITDEQTLALEWRTFATVYNLSWGQGTSYVGGLTPGGAYIHRIKKFANQEPHGSVLAVGSGGTRYLCAEGPSLVYSSDVISLPFVASVETHTADVYEIATVTAKIGTQFEYADYEINRCAFVVRSENLFTYSNSFGASDWTKSNLDAIKVTASDPLGGTTTWRLYVNSDEPAANHTLGFNAITKTNDPDMFTVGFWVRAGNGLDGIRLRLNDGVNAAYADFDCSVGSVFAVGSSAVFWQMHGKIWPCNSDYYRCQLTARCSSHSTLNFIAYAINSQGGSLNFTTTDTSYLEIVGGVCAKFPLLPHYFPTGNTEMVGSGEVTGSKLMLSGFDGEDRIKAGQRFELITRYHDDNNDVYERSEYKRITKEATVYPDGTATIYFDPPIRNAPQYGQRSVGTNNKQLMPSAILFTSPEMKARLLGGTVQYIDKPLRMTDIVFDVLEDLTEWRNDLLMLH
jgi:hypothetical protein